MKKALQTLASMFVILALITSCSDDDSASNNNNNNNPSETTIEYKLTVAEPVLTDISYKNAAGNMVASTESLENTTSWSKTITKPEGTFVATMAIEASTPVGSPVNYTMQILVNGVVKHSDSGSIIGDSSIDLSYEMM